MDYLWIYPACANYNFSGFRTDSSRTLKYSKSSHTPKGP